MFRYVNFLIVGLYVDVRKKEKRYGKGVGCRRDEGMRGRRVSPDQ